MAKEGVRLMPDTIRAIEEIMSKRGEAKVKNEGGIIKVLDITAKLVSAQEI